MTTKSIDGIEARRDPTQPALAVVIPVYNGRKHLAETLQSCLDQLHPAHEIIVVEDGSPEPSRDIVERFAGVRYVLQPNGGVSSARNHGASLASADWICFLDQDDLLLPEHLAQLSRAIRASEDTNLFYTPRLVLACNHGVWTTSYAAIQPPMPDELPELLLLRCPFPPSGVCVRRSVFEQIGGFHSRYDLAEDWEFWLRLSELGGAFALCPDATFCYRVHMESNSHRPMPILQANLRVIRERILPRLSFWRRFWMGKRLISAQEADAAILLRQMGQDGGAPLLLRSIVRYPFGSWRRYKIATHMIAHAFRHTVRGNTAGSRA